MTNWYHPVDYPVDYQVIFLCFSKGDYQVIIWPLTLGISSWHGAARPDIVCGLAPAHQRMRALVVLACQRKPWKSQANIGFVLELDNIPPIPTEYHRFPMAIWIYTFTCIIYIYIYVYIYVFIYLFILFYLFIYLINYLFIYYFYI